MANTFKRLAALRPADTNEAELYAPGSGVEVIALLNICNQDSSARTVRVALTDTSGAASGEDWIAYDYSVGANEIIQFTALTLENPNTIRVSASAADVISFVLFGSEIT